MHEKVTIYEQKPAIWNYVGWTSLLMTLLFFGLYLASEDPLWTGITRLVAFIAFAILVISMLQNRGKPRRLEISLDARQLRVDYYSGDRKVQEELFEQDTIQGIRSVPTPPALKILPVGDAVKYEVSFTDRSNTLSLFRIEGKDLYVGHEGAHKLDHFLEHQDLSVAHR